MKTKELGVDIRHRVTANLKFDGGTGVLARANLETSIPCRSARAGPLRLHRPHPTTPAAHTAQEPARPRQRNTVPIASQSLPGLLGGRGLIRTHSSPTFHAPPTYPPPSSHPSP